MEKSSDDVSRIHNRYSLTLINPSSQYFSLLMSVIIGVVLTITTFVGYLNSNDFYFRLPLVVSVLLATQFIDSRYIRNKEYSKSLHSSLFGNIIWLLVALTGILSSSVLGKEISLFFIVEGMFLFASFRIGIYTTVLGANIKKAWAVCFVQPIAMFLAIIPSHLWVETLVDPIAITYGIIFLSSATVWSILTDRSGRPEIQSTHKLIQAYLASQRNDFSEVEQIIEQRSKKTKIGTSQIRFQSNNNQNFSIVLPDVHPGPYHPVGGSNIPYLIYDKLNSKAMVMHSISDHALNIPSKNEVEKYLKSIDESTVKEEGVTCTEPVTVQINKSRVIGLSFEQNALLFLSLSPHGMEDLPSYIKTEIEQYAKNRKFNRVMIVDCHNAMGEEISKENGEDMLKAAKSCLDSLITKESHPIELGYANSKDMNLWTEDLGMGGLGIICLKIKDSKYFVGWADANNMENGVREKIVDEFSKKGYQLLEICTSDTHYAPVKARNKNGYYQFGLITSPKKISDWYLQIAEKAEKNTTSAKFEILEHNSEVKIMGPKIFEDYSKALENSMKLVKIFMIGCTTLFLSSLFL